MVHANRNSVQQQGSKQSAPCHNCNRSGRDSGARSLWCAQLRTCIQPHASDTPHTCLIVESGTSRHSRLTLLSASASCVSTRSSVLTYSISIASGPGAQSAALKKPEASSPSDTSLFSSLTPGCGGNLLQANEDFLTGPIFLDRAASALLSTRGWRGRFSDIATPAARPNNCRWLGERERRKVQAACECVRQKRGQQYTAEEEGQVEWRGARECTCQQYCCNRSCQRLEEARRGVREAFTVQAAQRHRP